MINNMKYTPKNKHIFPNILNQLPYELIQLIFDNLILSELCNSLLICKYYTNIIKKYTRNNKKIIKLDKLPINSYLFINICYFEITYERNIDDIPNKENETHLIRFMNKSCNITNNDLAKNINKINNIYSVDIIDCLKITDVSALRNVHTLYLCECTGIINVSALRNVHKLNLSGCTQITNVNSLGNIYELNLAGCTGIEDVSALYNVTILCLQGCVGITDVSMLRNVHILYLYGCMNIPKENIAILKSINKKIRIY